MLILLISSYCKMCTLPTLQSRMFVCCTQYKHARSYCWQWTHFTMGPNEQNQHFAELRQKNCLYIHIVVLLTCLPSLDGKLECFVTKKWQKWLPNSSQTDYNWFLINRALSTIGLFANGDFANGDIGIVDFDRTPMRRYPVKDYKVVTLWLQLKGNAE